MSKKRKKKWVRRLAHVAVAGVGVALVTATPAAALDFTVTTLDDGGPGSLRAQVGQAESTPGADRILFESGLSGSIVLTEGEIGISHDLQIVGPGHATVTVDGNATDRIFVLGEPGQPTTVEISGLTLANGSTDFGGGAISTENTELTLEKSVVSNNRSTSYGGGILANGGGSVTIRDTTFIRNFASVMGGAVLAAEHDVLIQGSTFDRNRAGLEGGAIGLPYGPEPTTVRIENSTLDGNATEIHGGAIAPFTGAPPQGSFNPKLEIRSSTISGNKGGEFGGGISGGFQAVSIQNSIVAGNFALKGPDLYSGAVFGGCNCGDDTTFDVDFSLVEDPAQAVINETAAGSNILGTDPGLGTLTDNGGPTETRAIGPGSPVVNQGASSLATDQRGDTRPVLYPGIPDSAAAGANGADMGAFELQSDVPPPPPPPVKNGPFKILGSIPKADGTAIVKVKAPAPGEITLLGYKRLKTVTKRADAKGVFKFRATPKGKLKKRLNKRGRAWVLVKFHYSPDSGRTLDKGRMFPFRKG